MNAAGDDEVMVLRGAGVAIWNALAAPKAPEEVASGLGEQYGRPPEALLDEVQPFIEQLVRHRLVEPVEPVEP